MHYHGGKNSGAVPRAAEIRDLHNAGQSAGFPERLVDQPHLRH